MNRNDQNRGSRAVPHDFGTSGPAYEEYAYDHTSNPADRDRRPLQADERYGGRGEGRPFQSPDSRHYSSGMNTGPSYSDNDSSQRGWNYNPSAAPNSEKVRDDRNQNSMFNPSGQDNRSSNWQEQNRNSMGQFYGKGPKNYKRSDERIHDDINEHLTQHPQLDAENIEVRVLEGEVTLSGFVPSRQCKRTAEDIAEQTFGVKDIRNELRIQASSSQR